MKHETAEYGQYRRIPKREILPRIERGCGSSMEGDTYQTGSTALMQIRDILHVREKEPAIGVKRLAAAREAGLIAARRSMIARARKPGEKQGAAKYPEQIAIGRGFHELNRVGSRERNFGEKESRGHSG